MYMYMYMYNVHVCYACICGFTLALSPLSTTAAVGKDNESDRSVINATGEWSCTRGHLCIHVHVCAVFLCSLCTL